MIEEGGSPSSYYMGRDSSAPGISYNVHSAKVNRIFKRHAMTDSSRNGNLTTDDSNVDPLNVTDYARHSKNFI